MNLLSSTPSSRVEAHQPTGRLPHTRADTVAQIPRIRNFNCTTGSSMSYGGLTTFPFAPFPTKERRLLRIVLLFFFLALNGDISIH
ncbi:hypothetical protein H6P81_008932 [Aristolochia fimbriata]|uniref:Uncharacterized protein n=1 Tax=Aristolochia fimbriata TaxID=158543 RepID=A0AAV7EMM1_ARIFI|nr:hypothetical protein H6P81_008932 [Aristolochia fimbriata]